MIPNATSLQTSALALLCNAPLHQPSLLHYKGEEKSHHQESPTWPNHFCGDHGKNHSHKSKVHNVHLLTLICFLPLVEIYLSPYFANGASPRVWHPKIFGKMRKILLQ
jgi:hypothetical protein